MTSKEHHKPTQGEPDGSTGLEDTIADNAVTGLGYQEDDRMEEPDNGDVPCDDLVGTEEQTWDTRLRGPRPTPEDLSEIIRQQVIIVLEQALEQAEVVRIQQGPNVLFLEAALQGLHTGGIEVTYIPTTKENDDDGTSKRPTTRHATSDGR